MDFNFAERLAAARQERGLTQRQLADRLGVTAQAVSKWETGGSLPDLELLRMIAQQLECSVDFLLEHEVNGDSKVNMMLMERTAEIEKAICKDVLTIQAGAGLIPMMVESNGDHYQVIHNLRMRLASEWGISVPIIRMMDKTDHEPDEYSILLHGKPVVKWKLEYPKRFYFQNEEGAIPVERLVRDPVYDIEGTWSDTEFHGCHSVSAMELMVGQLDKIIVQNYDKIINRQTVRFLVDIVRKRYPAVVEGVVPEKVSLSRLQRVIGGLVVQGCPVNRLDYIIEFLEDYAQEDISWQVSHLKAVLLCDEKSSCTGEAE